MPILSWRSTSALLLRRKATQSAAPVLGLTRGRRVMRLELGGLNGRCLQHGLGTTLQYRSIVGSLTWQRNAAVFSGLAQTGD